METRPTVCLVDGSGYIFRAFYALPPMTRPDGVPVNAVYGFMNMMMNLSQDNLCSHIVVIRPDPTGGRSLEYPVD